MIQIRQTEVFAAWFRKLRDRRAKARIQVRIDRLELGLTGDAKSVGEGVSELRIDYGPGYRVYYVARGREVVILLAGGDKRTQSTDIRTAIELAQPVGENMAKNKTRKYDVAAYLESEADVAAYLQAALEDGDAAVIVHALGNIARARGMSQIARRTGLARESLYKALSPNGNPEFATVLKVVRALGIELHAEPAHAQ